MAQYQEIANFIKGLEDRLSEINTVFQFLQKVQRSYNPAPIVEIYTVLKYEKPSIFKYLKQRVGSNPSLKLMIDVSIDYKLAKQRLGLDEKEGLY